MVKCIKEILNQPKFVLNNPVNLRHTNVNKSKLVLESKKFHIMVKCIKQILDQSRLVSNNPVNSCHTKLDKFKLVLKNPVN